MEQITVYTTTWCGWCRRLTGMLQDHRINFREVDIDHDPSAAELVATVNNGTVRFRPSSSRTGRRPSTRRSTRCVTG